MVKEDSPKLGICPLCGVNMDMPGVGRAHNCRPRAVAALESKVDPITANNRASAKKAAATRKAKAPKSRIIVGLESAVAYAKGDKTRGKSTIVSVKVASRKMKSHPDCEVCKANRDYQRELMRARRAKK